MEFFFGPLNSLTVNPLIQTDYPTFSSGKEFHGKSKNKKKIVAAQRIGLISNNDLFMIKRVYQLYSLAYLYRKKIYGFRLDVI